MVMANLGEAGVGSGRHRASGRSGLVESTREVFVPPGSPFASDCIRWGVEDGRCGATLVVKATLHLEPEQARLADTPEPIATSDCFVGDGAFAPLHIPSDLAPLKRHPEVMLVGRAYAPPGRRAQSLLARLHVGNVDKRVEVRPARFLHADGSVSEEPPWLATPLSYELAGGGPGTWNPVGVAPSGAGGIGLPRLAHPGTSWHPGAGLDPVSFGPLSPVWPTRASRLGGNESWVQDGMRHAPFPRNLDPLFFQAAPVDQLLEVLRPNERLVLEHLSPSAAVLTTRLPGIVPSAIAERPGREDEAVELVADTLWIDTERRLCTMTWRGFVALSDLDEPMFFRVEEMPTWIPETASTNRRATQLPVREAVEPDDQSDTLTGTVSLNIFEPMAALPFAPSAPAIASIPPAPLMPSGLRRPDARRPSPPPEASAPSIAPGAAAVLQMSNAAADTAEDRRSRATSEPPNISSVVERHQAEVVDLIWFDSKSLPRVRKPAAWKAIVEALEDRPPDPELDDAALAESTARAEDRRDVFEILVRGEAADGAGIEAGLERAIREDGKVVPPLMLVAGELSLPFDEVEVLRAHASAVAPLAPGDDRLSAEVALVKSYLSTAELGCSPLMLEALTSRLWAAFSRVKRAVSAETLQAHADAVLLHKRRFQRREVFGGDHIRAVLHAGGALGPFPTYLPASLASSLPLYREVRARVIAEVHPSVDQHEACPIALRLFAFARIVPRLSSRAPAGDLPMRGRR